MKFAEHLGAHITPEWRKQCKSFTFSIISIPIVKTVLDEFTESKFLTP